MDAAVDHLGQEPEAGRVVVEQRQRDQRAAHDPARGGAERAEAHLGIELLLELPRLGFVEFRTGHAVSPAPYLHLHSNCCTDTKIC